MAHLSTVEIGFRDNDNTIDVSKYWTLVNDVPYDEPCIFVLGGDGTRAGRIGANGYAKIIKSALAQNMNAQSLENLKVYGAAWDFGRTDVNDKEAKKLQEQQLETHDADIARWAKFEQYGHKKPEKVKLIEYILALYSGFMAMGSVYADMFQQMIDVALADTVNPQYIQKLFDVVILPRISDNGKKLDKGEAIKRIRNVTIWAHCHGAYVFISLEELMQKKMLELGYTQSEMRDIQKQLFCVAWAPMMPLDISKSTVVSFASMYDKFLIEDHNNIFTWYIENYRRNLADQDEKHGMTGEASTTKDISYLVEDTTNNQIAFFPGKQGNVFVFPHLGDGFRDTIENTKILLNKEGTFDNILLRSEHNLEYKEKNPYALIWRTFMANALGNSLKSAIEGTPIPDIKDLVAKLDYKDIQIKDTNDHRRAHNFIQLDAEMNAYSELVHKEKEIDENHINEILSVFYGLSEPQKPNEEPKETDVVSKKEQPTEQMLSVIFETALQNGKDIYNRMKTSRFIKGQGTLKAQLATQNNYFLRHRNSKEKQ